MGVNLSVSSPKIFNYISQFKPETANLILQMLQSSPVARISSFEIIKHPYFSKYQLEWNRKLNTGHKRKISTNLNIKPQHKLQHVNSQPFLSHMRSASEKELFNLRQISLSKNKNLNFEQRKQNRHFRTETCDFKIENFIEK